VSAKNLLVTLARNKRLKHWRFAFINSNRKTVALDVERKVLPHYAKSYESYLCIFCHINPISLN
jgi:hypothetical protein